MKVVITAHSAERDIRASGHFMPIALPAAFTPALVHTLLGF